MDIPNETKIADHVLGFLTIASDNDLECATFIPLSNMVTGKTLKLAQAQEQPQNQNSHPTNSSLFQDKTFSHLSKQSDQLHHVKATLD